MSKEKGDFAEKRAISFLEDSNFKIIETNFYAKKLGEIDIIAKKDNIYHFCEVKSASDYESAVNNLTNSMNKGTKPLKILYLIFAWTIGSGSYPRPLVKAGAKNIYSINNGNKDA